MKKNIINIITILIIIGGCSKTNDLESTKFITKDEYFKTVESIKNDIELLKSEISQISDDKNSYLINPIVLNDELLYINSSIPFAFTLTSESDLKLEVYFNDNGISIYYRSGDVFQFVESYQMVPTLLVKDQPDSAEYYYSKDIVKTINNDWVIVKVKSIETSLDEETNKKISKILDIIKFY